VAVIHGCAASLASAAAWSSCNVGVGEVLISWQSRLLERKKIFKVFFIICWIKMGVDPNLNIDVRGSIGPCRDGTKEKSGWLKHPEELLSKMFL
jgi:hypothetical protein